MADYIKYLGHSAIYIKSGEYGILIDPWFLHNKNVKFDIEKETITHILLTHGHSDHLGDTVSIAKYKKSEVISIFETSIYIEKQGIKSIGVGLGSEINFNFGTIRFLPATHTNSLPNGDYGGVAASILLNINGTTIFHAGDSGLTKEYELIGELYHPYFAFLPIGGYFTMGIEEAVIAAKMLKATEIIPIHYNTFPLIKANPNIFKSKIEDINTNCNIMNINDEITL